MDHLYVSHIISQNERLLILALMQISSLIMRREDLKPLYEIASVGFVVNATDCVVIDV